MTTGLQSIADLTASTRITTGDIPPPLVGASMTVIGTKLYLFAGRLVSSRKMTNDLYILDLETFIWTKIVDNSETLPNGRYFHSANIHKKSIVFFGGMGYARNGGEELCVLDDVVIYNIETFTWHYPEIKPSHSAPKPRYAHLAAITANKLLVIGGQDMSNHYIEEINVLDLDEMTWTISRSFDKHCGAYRSIAVSSRNHTELPVFGNDMAESVPLSPYSSETASITSSIRSLDSQPPPPPPTPISHSLRKSTSANSLPSVSTPPAYASPRKMSAGTFNYSGPRRGQPANHIISRMQGIENSYCRLSYSTSVTDDNPNPVYIYSNYNFTDVKRELQVVAPPTTSNFQIMDHSTSMTGAFLPPGLRFPTGYILGHYLIISGTYLTNASQTFSVWALNLANLVWTRIDTGSTFTHGSWNRGVLCEVTNKYIVLGNRDRALVEDYNHRQTNFDHVAIIDLEAFGVYQPPPATMSPSAQELGLALISEPNMADYEIVTIDGYRIPVNSMMLSARWPHFRALAEAQANRVPEVKYDSVSKKGEEEATITMYNYRALEFPEPYAVAIAFIQYLYTDNLLTLQQHQPAILAQLLLLADMYDLERLRQLASHALHQNLNMSTAALIYETAALSKQSGLQIRALKSRSINGQLMRRPSGSEHDSASSQWSAMSGGSPTSLYSPQIQFALQSQYGYQTQNQYPMDVRTSYYDLFASSVAAQSPPVVTRPRASSSVTAYTSSFHNQPQQLPLQQQRPYLPTIHDSMTDIFGDDDEAGSSTGNSSMPKSDNNFRSGTGSSRMFAGNGYSAAGGTVVHTQDGMYGL